MLDEWLHRYRKLAHMVQSAAAVTGAKAVHATQRINAIGAMSSEEESDEE